MLGTHPVETPCWGVFFVSVAQCHSGWPHRRCLSPIERLIVIDIGVVPHDPMVEAPDLPSGHRHLIGATSAGSAHQNMLGIVNMGTV
jgi:hypothetical protein